MIEDPMGVLTSAITATGVSLKKSAADVALYTTQRAAHLSTLVGQPGYEEAVAAERDAVLLYAGVAAVREADAADMRLVGIIEGVLLSAATGA